MATAKRRINSTNRKRISQEAVDIRLLETAPGTPQRVAASIDLSKFAFPPSAGVAIEAYRSSSLMRFRCGTVGKLEVPPVMVLDELDAGGNVQFRVKVVDLEDVVGKLLGSASRIRPRSDEKDDGRRSLFPIDWTDLGQEIWGVDVDDEDRPVLQLNLHMPDLEARIQTDPLLRGVIMPAAFRIVLTKLVTLLPLAEDDESDWKQEWLKFCSETLEIDDDPAEQTPEERAVWVQDAVRTFADRASFLDNAKRSGDRE